MAKATLQVDGIEELVGKLKRNATLKDVRNVVRLNGSELDRRMTRNASFVKGYQTGTTKRSIELTILDDGFTAHVAPTTHYSLFLELGTRMMDAQPFVYPSFTVQRAQFIKDLKRLTK